MLGRSFNIMINPKHCIAADVKSMDGGFKKMINPVQCAAAMIKSKDGAKPQKEYSPG